jgi:L-lactate dehydrogenase (cytochrome)
MNHLYPSIEHLRIQAHKKVPGFALDYLESGCNEEINLKRNTQELREIQLIPHYIDGPEMVSLKTSLFGHEYDAPFGISPIGLQGLIWPGASEILAKAAFEHNIPFILSTVGTASIEKIAEITHGQAWFQLYHPAEERVTNALLERAKNAGIQVLVLLTDVPTFGHRYKDMKNGLSLPPRMTFKNILQIMSRPDWAISTLIKGSPKFETMLPYTPKGLNMKQLGYFMNKSFNGRITSEQIQKIREKWKGKLIIKGVAGIQDVQKALKIGIDGLLVSNHGGRQIDAGESSIQSLLRVKDEIDNQIPLMMDSGIRTGPDVVRSLAAGAQFTFLGRSMMYGVGALGKKGGDHTIQLLKNQILQAMQQIGAQNISEIPNHLVNDR